MKFILSCVLCLVVSISTLAQQKQFKALLITATRGFHHESIHTGVLALQQLGVKNNFDVDVLSSPQNFNDKYLAQYKVIIFLNTTGDIFDSASQGVMERFIRSGKGFVGIHAAADTEYEWEWYTKLVGRTFVAHPAIQTAKMIVSDPAFPGLQGFANGKLWTDEWYEYSPEKTTGLKYILSVDDSSYKPKNPAAFHPISWYHQFDGGRSFYTGMGHLPSVYTNTDFLDHLYAGIWWAATGRY